MLCLKYFIFIIFFIKSSLAFSDTKEFLLNEGRLLIIAPPVINKNYFLSEFGYVIQKKIMKFDYSYNAYVDVALFEDWLNQKDNQKAAALGFKGGVILPTQHELPFLATITLGYAKSILHPSPIFGREDAITSKHEMVFFELGALYHYQNYFLKLTYQKSNVQFFKRHTFLALGVNY